MSPKKTLLPKLNLLKNNNLVIHPKKKNYIGKSVYNLQ